MIKTEELSSAKEKVLFFILSVCVNHHPKQDMFTTLHTVISHELFLGKVKIMNFYLNHQNF